METEDEIRAVLGRHWEALDRARLQTFYLVATVWGVAQIFIACYFSDQVRPFPFYWSYTNILISPFELTRL